MLQWLYRHLDRPHHGAGEQIVPVEALPVSPKKWLLIELLEGRTFLSTGIDLVLIDGSLAAQDAIARTAHTGAVVVIYDSRTDSSAEVLKRATDLAMTRGSHFESVSIVSHGNAGTFELGYDKIDVELLARSAEQWRAFGKMMVAGGNMYLFACETGSGTIGTVLVDELGRLTGRDVFASQNITGNGGDWNLEIASAGAHGKLNAGLEVPFDTRELESLTGVTLTIASGTEFRVNTTTTNTQNAGVPRAVAADANGNFVVTWESYDQDSLLTYGIYAQRYNAAGVAQGSEFLVNSASLLNDQRAPAIAMNASGDFIIAWEGTGLLGLFPGIYAQRYNAAGVAQGTEIAVDGTALSTFQRAAVAMDSSGKFVVVYQGPDASGEGIFARRYAADGTALGASFGVNVTTSNNQVRPDVAISASGGFVVTWSGEGTGDTAGVFASVYDSSGVVQAAEVRANTLTTGSQTRATVAAASDGGFVVAWSGNGTGDATGIWAQRMDSSLALVGSVIAVNVTTAGTQVGPSITMDPDNDFVIVWSGNGSGDGAGVFGREYAAGGTARTSEFLINTTTSGTQTNPSITAAGDNAYIATWDREGTGDTLGVFGQLFVNVPPAVSMTGSTLAFTENDSATVVDSGLSVSDTDDTVIAGATVTISANYANGEDVLAFTDQLGITGVWVAATGVLTLSGTASLANYQIALRAVTFANASESPSTGTRTITVVVNDGEDQSGAANRSISVTSVNDLPTLATTGTTLSYTESDGAVVVDAGVVVADIDTATLASATVTISGNYVNGEDALAFADQLGITGSWAASTGILTLSGTALLADYQTALRAITYANSSANPSTLSRTVSFVIHDGTNSSVAANRAISITAINNAPTVTTTGSTLGYTENDGAVAVDSGVTPADVDNTTLASATVTISGNYVNGEDVLSFVDQLGITGSWVAATGVLTLTGVASVANYQTALRAVTYANISNDPSTLSRTIAFVVHDGLLASSSASRTVSIASVNDAPIVTPTGSALAYTENDGAVIVDAGVLLTDADGTTIASATITISGNYVNGEDVLAFTDQLGITGSWLAATGVLTLTGTTSIANYQAAIRSITYSNGSDNPSTATRTISFVASDGVDSGLASTRSITITAVNDATTVTTTGSVLAYAENDGAAVVDSSVSLSDVDNMTLQSATVTISGNYVNGEDILAFVDQFGITGVWAASTGILTLTGVASLANYQSALRSITYTNGSDDPSVLARTVSFVVHDGTDASAAATRTISITAANDAPTVTTTGTTLVYTENDGAILVDGGLTISDADNATLASATVTLTGNYVNGEDVLAFADQLGITGIWAASTGILTLTGVTSVANYQAALRSITYANGSDNPSVLPRTVSFAVHDGTDESAAATRTIALTAVNDAPTAVTTGTDLAYTENDGAVVLDTGVTIADIDNSTLSSATVTISANYVNGEDLLAFVDQLGISGSWAASTGILTLTGVASLADYQTVLRTITYTNGSENPSVLVRTVAIVLNDGANSSAAATRNIALTAVNDAPTVVTTGSTLSYTENDGAVVADGGLTVGDVDNATLAGASVTISANYVNGEDVLSFTDQFGISGTWAASTGILTLTGVASVANYQIALRSITYSNVSDNPSVLLRTVSFVVNDGADASAAATRNITITAVNDAPTVTTTVSALSYTENDGAVVVDSGLTVADVDNNTLLSATVTISGNYVNGEDILAFTDQFGIAGTWAASTGTLTLTGAASLANYQAALRSITYTNGSDNPSAAARTVSYVVNDGTDSSVAAARTITIATGNDAPTVATTSSTLAYTENDGATVVDSGVTIADLDSAMLASATVTISGNYVNGEDVLVFTDQLGISGSFVAATGVLTLTGSASLADYQTALRSIAYLNGSDNPSTLSRTVSFLVHDGTDPSAAASRVISIAAVNDAPIVIATGSPLAYTENDGAIAVDTGITLGDMDDALLISATIAISGNYVNGEDSLLFTAQSGISGTWAASTGTLTLSGTATLANYQAAMRSIRYLNNSEIPSNATRTVTFVVDDGTVGSAAETRNIVLAPQNDAPVVITSGSTLGYLENGGAVVVDAGASVSDVDSTTLVAATVTISGNYVIGEDVLSFTDQLGITGSWVAATGVLTLSGVATVASYQSALRSITYTNGSDNPSVLARTVSFAVDDGTDPSATATRLIGITAVNDATVVVATGSALSYTENAGGVILDSGVTVTDLDNLTLVSATVTIIGSYVNGEDVLTFTDQSGIVGSWAAATGVLTLSGVASVAAYEAALRAVNYANVSNNPSTSMRTVTFVVSDGTDTSSPAERTIALFATNDAPTMSINGATLAYVENGGPIALDGSASILDPDNTTLVGASVSITGNYAIGEDVLAFVDQLGISGVWSASTGTLTLSGVASLAVYQSALRAVTYSNTSDDPSTASRTISCVVNDGVDTSTAASRLVSLAAVNDAPTVVTSGFVLAFIENGAAAVVDGGVSIADLDNVMLAGATVAITANYVNGEDALVFADQLGITGSWSATTGVLTLSGVASVESYQLALRTVRYSNVSDNPSIATRTVEFAVNDGADWSIAESRLVSVTAINDAPTVIATGTVLAYIENNGNVAVGAGLAIADADSSLIGSARFTIAGYVTGEDILEFTDQFGISSAWESSTGVLTLTGAATVSDYQSALRSVTYRNASEHPTTSNRIVSVVVHDGVGVSAAAMRVISIARVNDAPSLNMTSSILGYTENDGPVILDGAVSISDADDATLAGALLTISGNFVQGEDALEFTDQLGISGSWEAATGLLTLSGAASVANYQIAIRSIRYANTSENPSTLQRTVSVVVTDGTDNSLILTRAITIATVNDAPVVTNTGGMLEFTENGGSLPVDAGVSLSDLDTAVFSSATVSIAANYAAGEDVLTFVDQRGISGTWDSVNGVLVLSGLASIADYQFALRQVSYINVSDAPSSSIRIVEWVVNDGIDYSITASRSVLVMPVNDAPVVSATGASVNYQENAGAIVVDAEIVVTDLDSPNLSGATLTMTGNYFGGEDTLALADQMGISAVWSAVSGRLTLSGVATIAQYQSALRAVTYRNNSDTPSDLVRVISIVVHDGSDSAIETTRTIAVTSVNDAPAVLASNAVIQFTEGDNAVVLDPALTIADADGVALTGATVSITGNYVIGEDVLVFTDQLGITGIWSGATGTLTLSGVATLSSYQLALRTVTYTNLSGVPSPSARTIRWAISDGTVESSAAETSINVSTAYVPIDESEIRMLELSPISGEPVSVRAEIVLTAIPAFYEPTIEPIATEGVDIPDFGSAGSDGQDGGDVAKDYPAAEVKAESNQGPVGPISEVEKTDSIDQTPEASKEEAVPATSSQVEVRSESPAAEVEATPGPEIGVGQRPMQLDTPMSPELLQELGKLHEQLQASAGSSQVTGTVVACSAVAATLAYSFLNFKAGISGIAMLQAQTMWGSLDPSTLLKAQSSTVRTRFLWKK